MRLRRVVAVAVVLSLSVALGACALVAGIDTISIDSDGGAASDATLAQDGPNGTDRDTSVDPGDAATESEPPFDAGELCSPTATFGTPTAIAELNSGTNEWSARLTPDERTVYFASDRDDGGSAHIYSATRASRGVGFDAPAHVGGTTLGNTPVYHPSFLPNQQTLVVQFANGGGVPVVGISTRSSTAVDFSTPAAIASVNAGGGENLNPFLTSDGNALWFSSDRALSGTHNVYESVIAGGVFGAPSVVALGLSTDDAKTPVLSDDKLTLYFSSLRSTTGSDYEVYRATRSSPEGSWGTPVKVPEVNASGSYDAPSWLSPDGCRLYLMSNRSNVAGGELDLYVATRQP